MSCYYCGAWCSYEDDYCEYCADELIAYSEAVKDWYRWHDEPMPDCEKPPHPRRHSGKSSVSAGRA